MPGTRAKLDNPVFRGRLRGSSTYSRRVAAPVRSRTSISDMRTVPTAKAPSHAGSGHHPATRHAHVVVASKPPAAKSTGKSKSQSAVRRGITNPFAARTSPSSVLRREAFKSRPAAAKKSVRRRSVSLRGVALTSMAVTLFALALGIGISSLRTNQQVAAQVKHIANASESSDGDPVVPSETKPASGTATYSVAPTLPRTIVIPKLGVDARILRLGVKSNNELRAPANIFDAGWYDGSAKPGEAGAMLIDGHVSGPTQHGVFYGLKTLAGGDQIMVSRGDGKIFTYRVQQVKTYDADKVDMAAALTPVIAGKPGLNLISCSGSVDSTGTGFTQRTVVFAVQE